MINARIIGGDEVIARLSNIGRQAPKALEAAFGPMAQELMSGYVIPLVSYSSGRLAASLTARVENDGERLEAVITPATPYAAFIEYGFTGTETVAGHMRMQRLAWGREMASPHEVWVKPYSRDVAVPAHSYLRAGLAGYVAAGGVGSHIDQALAGVVS